MASETTSLLAPAPSKASFSTFLRSFWPLAFIAFGGPQAHISLMLDRYVHTAPPHLKVSESTFLELLALSQSLPGPASTQLATSLGATFGGVFGAFITFFVWHLPGFFAMSVAGVWFHHHLGDNTSASLIYNITDHAVGLIAAAFAFVLLATFTITSKVCGKHPVKMAISLVSMFVALTIPPKQSSWAFIALLVGGGIVYYAYMALSNTNQERHVSNEFAEWDSRVAPVTGIMLLLLVLAVTVLIALLPQSNQGLRLLKLFWRIGLCVFGGGTVVIPMLLNEFVESGLLPASVFLVGFGLFGCIPGPMFNLAPFLGAAVLSWPGAFYGSLGLFGPGIMLQVGLLPFWERVRKVAAVQTVLQGTVSAAVGLIVAGVWMVLQKALVGAAAFALTCLAGAFATVYKVPPAYNILITGACGFLLVVLGVGGPYHGTRG